MSEPSPSPPFSTGCADGVVAAYGDVDVVTCELFASAVDALVAEAVCRERRGGVRLDLAGVGFVGVAGARVLVEAAAVLPPGLELVVRHPPAMLARIVEVGWGQVAGLRFELSQDQKLSQNPREGEGGGSSSTWHGLRSGLPDVTSRRLLPPGSSFATASQADRGVQAAMEPQ